MAKPSAQFEERLLAHERRLEELSSRLSVISSLSPVSAKDFHTHKSEMRAEMDKLKAAYTEGHFPQERPEAIASPRAFPPSPPGLVSPNSFGRHDRIPPAREEGTVKGVGRSHNDVIQIPLKFQPLVEAMKAAGKALISVSDLEGQLKVWSVKLNVPVENINSLMSKATEAQIIIYDKAINYVRFRNRAIMTSQIECV